MYVHRNAFRESYELKEGQLCGSDDGIRWTDEEREAMKDRLILTDGPLWVSEDICVTGTVQSEEVSNLQRYFITGMRMEK